MSTLLLRLAGPMQSWGISSKYDERRTEREPSKSGVIGMVAAALGRAREESIDDLSKLKYGVRIDQIGNFLEDFHMANLEKSSGGFVTKRHYISDAVFVAGLEGDEKLLKVIDNAISNPVFPLFLGRKSCPPSGRISLGIRDKNLLESLKQEPWHASNWYMNKCKNSAIIEIVYDSDDGKGAIIRDVPVSFSQDMRSFTFRTVKHVIDGCVLTNDAEMDTNQDPFSSLKED